MSEPTRIEDAAALDAAFEASNETPVFLFKHSLVCPISSAAWAQYRAFVDEEGDRGRAEFRLIEIQNARPVSNAVAERTGVRHESPQALLLKHGEVQWHASHGGIRQETLSEALGRVAS